MIASAFVNFYRLVHGRLHVRGAGVVISRAARWVRGLQAYPLILPGVGTVTLDFRDQSARGMLNFSMGELESNAFMFRLIEGCLKPGTVFWDVGANIGWVCAHFAHPRLKLAAIHAFEPNPVAFKSLQSLFAKHPIVKVHAVALGSENKTAAMNIEPGATQLGSFRRSLGGVASVEVTVRRADDVQAELNLPLPDVIKIDVEGFEPQVIAGMQQLIARKKPIIFFEYQFLSDDEIRGLVPAGYEILLMLDDESLTADLTKRHMGHDAVIFPTERRALFEGVRRA
jgi:FkbM family methyltransferase